MLILVVMNAIVTTAITKSKMTVITAYAKSANINPQKSAKRLAASAVSTMCALAQYLSNGEEK